MLTESELKEKLITTINNTHDEELLNQMSRLVDLSIDTEDIYHLSAEEIEAVQEGLDQLDSGNYLSHDEVKKQTAEWLKK